MFDAGEWGSAEVKLIHLLEQLGLRFDAPTGTWQYTDDLEAWVNFESGKMLWSEISANASAQVNRGYITNNISRLTVTLPAAAAQAELIGVTGKGAGGWRIQAAAGQTIHMGDKSTIAGGYLQSRHYMDYVVLFCLTANTDFKVISPSAELDMEVS